MGSCKITQTVSDSNHPVLNRHLGLSIHHSGIFSFPCIIWHLLYLWLCIVNLLYCPGGLSVDIILNLSFFHFIPCEETVWSFLSHKIHFRSLVAQWVNGLDTLYIDAAPGLILCWRHWVDGIGSTALLSCDICPPEVGNRFFSVYWPL